MKTSLLLICFLTFISCVQNKGPEETLKSYINNRFSNEVEKDDFKKYFAGELLTEMEGLTEEAINKINEVKGQKKKSFKINFKRCTDEKCFLTYTLVYDTHAQATVGNPEASHSNSVRVKVKKIAELRKIQKSWRIYGISDIKTLYDYKTLK
jgi:hypothetical protein